MSTGEMTRRVTEAPSRIGDRSAPWKDARAPNGAKNIIFNRIGGPRDPS